MNNDIAIRVENLGKRYRIGLKEEMHDTFGGAIADLVRRPLKNLRRLRSLTRFQDDGDDDGVIWALKDVSFEVKRGEVLGVVGRNGAGKSTLLKILSRIIDPTEGEAMIDGRVGSLLEVGTGFHPELTGRQNMYLNGTILGMKKAEIDRKFDEIVAFAEIERFIDTPVKRYSSGMYVRLAFAVAAHLEPEILLVDEVLAVGDAAFRKKCLGKMRDVSQEGRTVLFVSHNMAAVERLCEEVVWLEEGRVTDIGDTKRVVSSYLQVGMIAVMEQVWDDPANAPGNDKVRLRRVCVKSLNEKPGEPITIKTPLQLEFEFWNYMADELLSFSIHLHTVEGTSVFAVNSDASPRPKGIVRGGFQIPSDFLNDGVYRVMIMIVKDRSIALYQHPDVLAFEVQDAGRAGSWFGKWPGAVRPKFDFLTESIELSE